MTVRLITNSGMFEAGSFKELERKSGVTLSKEERKRLRASFPGQFIRIPGPGCWTVGIISH